MLIFGRRCSTPLRRVNNFKGPLFASDTLSTTLILGRGHTNYDIQIIVVLLKVTTRFFKQGPWIIGQIIMIVLGSHMLNMNYEVYCGSASVELTQ